MPDHTTSFYARYKQARVPTVKHKRAVGDVCYSEPLSRPVTIQMTYYPESQGLVHTDTPLYYIQGTFDDGVKFSYFISTELELTDLPRVLE